MWDKILPYNGRSTSDAQRSSSCSLRLWHVQLCELFDNVIVLNGKHSFCLLDLFWFEFVLEGTVSLLFLLLCSKLDLWGSPFLVRFCVRDGFFFFFFFLNPTIEVVTFRLRGGCMLGVFVAGLYSSKT